MNIAYMRVSTVEQRLDRQRIILEPYNIEKWYEEKISAKDTKRPKLQEMLEFAREGDTIYIADFSRIARSTQDLLNIVKELEEKKINLVSIKESIDSKTPTGKLLLTMIGAINEFERENLLERQRIGIQLAKQRGAYKNVGRKRIKRPDNWSDVYNVWEKRDITAKKAMEQLGLTKNIFYQFVKEEKQKTPG